MLHLLLPLQLLHLLRPLLLPPRHIVESMNLLVDLEVVVGIQVVVESLLVGEFGLPSSVLLVVALLAYVTEDMNHETHLPKMVLFFEQFK